jgi:hypothetical protein
MLVFVAAAFGGGRDFAVAVNPAVFVFLPFCFPGWTASLNNTLPPHMQSHRPASPDPRFNGGKSLAQH